MPLMKPRRWLGYEIALNDLLPQAEEILERFERSTVPLDDTFGSSSSPATPPRSTILYIGRDVEPSNLCEILDLLEGIPVHFLQTDEDEDHRKTIYIGSLDLENDPVAPLTDALSNTLRKPGCTAAELHVVVKESSTLSALTVNPRRSE